MHNIVDKEAFLKLLTPEHCSKPYPIYMSLLIDLATTDYIVLCVVIFGVVFAVLVEFKWVFCQGILARNNQAFEIPRTQRNPLF